uniref:U-scoloptoxin(02)-Er1a n=1 Tax=Ethmostigmus rubripes TaxID=62613 RepID=TX21A_ETHRU|nr:RecName: Full=U-scoloptoxin(02)-Er1a; Short=U-SLPTX(02)-Er1a; Flags: Precursor [Ethmostigmus rubripes]
MIVSLRCCLLLVALLITVETAIMSKRDIVCSVSGDVACNLECELLHKKKGSCDENGACTCFNKKRETE